MMAYREDAFMQNRSILDTGSPVKHHYQSYCLSDAWPGFLFGIKR